jgi:hypothetical protein
MYFHRNCINNKKIAKKKVNRKGPIKDLKMKRWSFFKIQEFF